MQGMRGPPSPSSRLLGPPPSQPAALNASHRSLSHHEPLCSSVKTTTSRTTFETLTKELARRQAADTNVSGGVGGGGGGGSGRSRNYSNCSSTGGWSAASSSGEGGSGGGGGVSSNARMSWTSSGGSVAATGAGVGLAGGGGGEGVNLNSSGNDGSVCVTGISKTAGGGSGGGNSGGHRIKSVPSMLSRGGGGEGDVGAAAAGGEDNEVIGSLVSGVVDDTPSEDGKGSSGSGNNNNRKMAASAMPPAPHANSVAAIATQRQPQYSPELGDKDGRRKMSHISGHAQGAGSEDSGSIIYPDRERAEEDHGAAFLPVSADGESLAPEQVDRSTGRPRVGLLAVVADEARGDEDEATTIAATPVTAKGRMAVGRVVAAENVGDTGALGDERDWVDKAAIWKRDDDNDDDDGDNEGEEEEGEVAAAGATVKRVETTGGDLPEQRPVSGERLISCFLFASFSCSFVRVLFFLFFFLFFFFLFNVFAVFILLCGGHYIRKILARHPQARDIPPPITD